MVPFWYSMSLYNWVIFTGTKAEKTVLLPKNKPSVKTKNCSTSQSKPSVKLNNTSYVYIDIILEIWGLYQNQRITNNLHFSKTKIKKIEWKYSIRFHGQIQQTWQTHVPKQTFQLIPPTKMIFIARMFNRYSVKSKHTKRGYSEG